MQGKYIEGNQQLCLGADFLSWDSIPSYLVFDFVFPTLMSTSIKNENISKYLVDQPKFGGFILK